MRPLVLIAAAASLAAAPPAPPPPAPSPDLSRLTATHRRDLQCAATLALAAQAQAQGDNAVRDAPPLAVRGKRYFAQVGLRVTREAGLTPEQVRDLMTADVIAVQKAADPDAALRAALAPCLVRLEAEVPPLKTPDLSQCGAILAIAYEELHAREGLTAAAQDLKTLASVLAAREREALVAAGKSGDEADAAIAMAHDAMLGQAFEGDGVEAYDIAHCYDLARPDPNSHY
ncbi:hypothetical protein [Novosphingobium huizhouense]|uniref:hypothetical protein n=1 Tax=Novosphingobium huizhouense TaxID=2866625 RepID=UPI001CD858AB|nr:hypothetical protein [Novosphingobium huizhouense]